jgi:hypothetical protein
MSAGYRRCSRAGTQFAVLAAALSASLEAEPAIAADGWLPEQPPLREAVMLQVSPRVIHFDPEPEHVEWSWLLGVEWQRPASRWHLGFSYFNNSFGQKSQFFYAGYVWKLSERNPNWYLKLSGGLLHGYKEPYEDKVPFNHNGYSPGLIPALGYKWERWNVQLVAVGTAGALVTVGYDVIR